MDEASAETGGFTKQAYGPHKGPVMKVRIVIPIFQKRKLRHEKLTDVSKVMAMRSGRDGIWTQALKLPGWTLKLPSHTTSYVTWTFVGARDTRCVCHTHFCYVLFSAGNLQENLDGDSFLRLLPEKILGRTSVTWWMDTEYQLPWRESQVQTKKKRKSNSTYFQLLGRKPTALQQIPRFFYVAMRG